MALFNVPGWSMPSDIKPVPDMKSRKRKRNSGDDSSSKLQNAEVNVEKLMEKLTEVGRNSHQKGKHKQKQKDRSVSKNNKRKDDNEGRHEPASASNAERKRDRPKKKNKKKLHRSSSSTDTQTTVVGAARPSQIHLGKVEASKVKAKKGEAHDEDGISKKTTSSVDRGGADAHLTSLQSRMKQGLDGARFRWINETLYKSSSREAERLMHEDPKVFKEYHAGFRHQVTSWPTNPVDHFIKALSSYPERSVIVDLGCGDAALAQNLVPKGYTVLSFDLISANAFIVAADICGKLPLSGSETEDEGQVVDVVVCCLSLMSTNWINCIREARRVLKKGGELKIAEVTSRFTSVDKFTSVICSIGFRLVLKDERNSHFTLFDFKKSEGSKNLEDKVWQTILARGDVLQPCEYKRR